MCLADSKLLVVLNVQHSRDVVLRELVVRIRDQQTGLSDGTITHNYQFDTNSRHFLCSTTQAASLGHLNTFFFMPTILFVHVPRKRVQLKLTASRFFQSRNLMIVSKSGWRHLDSSDPWPYASVFALTHISLSTFSTLSL